MLSGQWLRRLRPRAPSVVMPGAVFKHPARLVAGAETNLLRVRQLTINHVLLKSCGTRNVIQKA
jgi:hypothetical protein